MASEPQDEVDPLLIAFVEWFERENIGGTFDAFIQEHAITGGFIGASPQTEQLLAWTDIYQRYQQLFDDKLEAFCQEAGVTQEHFLASARAADGLHEAYLQIFLAHAEYDTFIELMAEEAEKQSA